MKTLKPEFRRWGATYRIEERSGDVVLLSRLADTGKPTSFDVAIVQRHDGYEIAGRKVEASEFLPSSEAYGSLAWSYSNRAKAEAKFADERSRQAV